MTDVDVEDVHKSLGSHLLKGASFSASKGMIVALLGASGSGKTTLPRCLAGLEMPERGRIAIGGKLVFDGDKRIAVPPEKRNIGLVFQSYALWPHKTVIENVAFGLTLRGVSSADAAKRVAATLEKLGLVDLGARYPFQLSGGQQQRVAICRALVYEPSVILLDGDSAKNRVELISRTADMANDATVTRQTIDMIWDLWRRRPGTVLVPGHDLPKILEGGAPAYLGKREAAINAWFGDDLDTTTRFELVGM